MFDTLTSSALPETGKSHPVTRATATPLPHTGRPATPGRPHTDAHGIPEPAAIPDSTTPDGTVLDAGTALALITETLGRVRADRSGLAPGDRLKLVSAAQHANGMLTSLLDTLIAEADQTQASMLATGTPSVSWLATTSNLSRKEAARMVFQAEAGTRRDQVRDAALHGQISPAQARAIGKVFDQLPETLTSTQKDAAEKVLLTMAARTPAPELERATDRVLAAVAPTQAAEHDGQRLQRQAEQAYRNRQLRFTDDHRGSLLFTGSLPIADGQRLVTTIHAYLESTRRAMIEARDPLTPSSSLEQRQADALMAMIRAHAQTRTAPNVGADRPRVVVTINQTDLKQGLLHTGRLANGQQLSAGELRRLACDAQILPIVLDGPSQILDVGRANRLVTPAIRAALTLRDQGCAFPQCDAPATRCEAHHIKPWWDGGDTALSNLVLACPHHHRLIEPAKYTTHDQWLAQIATDGTPEFTPPKRLDPNQTPLRHHRYHQTTDPPADDG